MAFCPSCGSKVGSSAAFCSVCGLGLGEHVADVTAWPAPTQESGPSKRRRRPTSLQRVLLVCALLVVVGGVARILDGSDRGSAVGGDQVVEEATSTPSTTAPWGIDRGLGSRDASRDVEIRACLFLPAYSDSKDSYVDSYQAWIQITNTSSERSNYRVTWALESSSGAVNWVEDTFSQDSLEPGQSGPIVTRYAGQSKYFFFEPYETSGRDYRCRITTVQRLAG